MLDLIPFCYAGIGLAGLAAALWSTRQHVVYKGQHRADRISTMRWYTELAAARERYYVEIRQREFPELADAGNDPAEFDTPAQTKGAYAHLRTAELDSTAERFFALVEKGIRPPSPWNTPMVDDDWDVPAGVELVAIGGRGAV